MKRCTTMFSVAVALSLAGCATKTTTRTTMNAGSGQVAYSAGRLGTVDQVELVTERVEGRPVAGAAAGAIAGRAITGSSAGTAGGAIAGTAMSSGSSERQTYEVLVRFDDGRVGTFDYRGQVPFRPGQRVVQTSNGLQAAN